MDRDADRESLRFPLRYNLIGIDCNSWGLYHIYTLSLSLTPTCAKVETHGLYVACGQHRSDITIEDSQLKMGGNCRTAKISEDKWKVFKKLSLIFITISRSNQKVRAVFLTCLDWLKSKTLWPCLNQRRSRDSTTISFPERFQKPNCSSTVSCSSGIPLSIRGPPEKRSGWLQILRSAIKPENT